MAIKAALESSAAAFFPAPILDLSKLKEASMGVFQITGKNSVEEDSYGGNNDTYNKEKTARITVRLTYELD